MALVGSTFGFHPLMVPSTVSKMKAAGPELPFFETTKSEVGFATIPVGELVVWGTEPGGGGRVTTRERVLPFGPYKVANPLLSLAIQNGPWGANAIPQALDRLPSVLSAFPFTFETRSRLLYCAALGFTKSNNN